MSEQRNDWIGHCWHAQLPLVEVDHYAAVAPSRRVTKKAGEWQTLRILCVGRSCSVWVNGEQVIEVDLEKMAAKYGRKVPGLKRNSGLIGVQNHGDPVSFRKIVIKKIARK